MPYRLLVHFPPGEHEDLVAIWLWSERHSVFSHDTALALQGLSDVLPAKSYLTMPVTWRSRRLRLPRGVVPHFANVPDVDRTWVGAVPVTSPGRTVVDCALARLPPDLVRQALDQGLRQGLFSREMAGEAIEYVDRFDPTKRAS